MTKAEPQRRELTDRFVKTVEPGSKRTRYWDTLERGLVLQVEPTGHKAWKVAYRAKAGERAGKLEWYDIGRADKAIGDRSEHAIGLSAARVAARKVMALVTLDQNPQDERRKAKDRAGAAVTFQAVCDRYLEEHAKPSRRAWAQGDALRRRHALPTLGKRPIAAIRRGDIRAIFNDLTTVQRHPILANQVLAAISAVLSWAIREDLLEHNAAHGIMLNPTQSRERVLADAEVVKFWEAFDEAGLVRSRALRMILLSGQRPGEVRHMHRAHLEIGKHRFTDANGRTFEAAGAWWNLPGKPDPKLGWLGTKNAQSHRVWLPKAAVSIIEELGGGGFVFAGARGRPVTALDAAMKKACKRAGIAKPDKITPHDLRRTFATTAASLGFHRQQLDRALNHADGGVGAIYDRFEYADEARRIAEAVAARIMSLVEGGGADIVVEFSRSRAS